VPIADPDGGVAAVRLNLRAAAATSLGWPAREPGLGDPEIEARSSASQHWHDIIRLGPQAAQRVNRHRILTSGFQGVAR
jgi:hypothetical protein